MRILLLLGFATLLAIPIAASAHGSPYFEFAPDISYRVSLANGQTLTQFFTPQNDFLKGIDAWLDNAGAPGIATFELRTESGALIVSKTVTVPTIAPVWSGVRFHVDFPNQLTLVSETNYELRIISGLPELGVYVANRAQLLTHTSAYYSEYLSGLVGGASLNGVPQEFAAKFALYEVSESVPPEITNAAATVLSAASVRIEFNANEPVDFRAVAQTQNGSGVVSTAYTETYQACGESLGLCALTIETAPSTPYQFTLFARDAWLNESSALGTFTTPAGSAGSGENSPAPVFIPIPPAPPPPPPGSPPPPPDTAPPTILNAQVVSANANAVTVAWSTNEAANSNLTVRLDSSQGPVVGIAQDATYELAHLLSSGAVLAPQAGYVAVLRSTDPAGNSNSLTLPFATLSTSGGTPPASPLPPAAEPNPPVQPPSPQTPPGPPGVQNSGAAPPAPGSETGQEPGRPAITVTAGELSSGPNGTATATITWFAPQVGGEPNRGYRVDVFDDDWNLTTQVIVPTGTHDVIVPNLAPGTYRIVIYENRGGILRKIAEPVILIIAGPSFFKKAIFLWSLFAFIFLAVGVVIAAIINRVKRHAKRAQKPAPENKDFIKYGQ